MVYCAKVLHENEVGYRTIALVNPPMPVAENKHDPYQNKFQILFRLAKLHVVGYICTQEIT